MASMVSLRLPGDLRREIERLAKREGKDKSELIREFLRRAVASRKVELALEAYQARKVSLGKAAELADLSLWEMLDVLRDRRIPLSYSAEDLEEDLRTLGELG
ncbi:MAG TPA: UPF0175 family protein [Thermoplasmata archaeon]|nr:UPF0175 family protein [Thermoplasmata archaeon]